MTVVALDVRDASQVAEARRACAAAAGDLDASRASDAAIVVTELATNLLKHAGGGVLVVQSGVCGSGVEVLALDRGRGFANIEHAMQDGYSTAGSPGNGLGAVRRLASAMELYTLPNQGSVIYAAITAAPRRGSDPRPAASRCGGFEVGGICVPLRGESECGDAFAVEDGERGCFVIVADGLGHGPLASEAARTALAVFSKRRAEGVVTAMGDIHEALRSTRGAAVSVAHVNRHQGLVRYCGIGNVIGAVVSPEGVRRMVTQNGTAGLGTPRISEFTYPWTHDSFLVMHTDGVGTKWTFDPYPGLSVRHPALIAGTLYRDFARERDDATVVVVREADG